MVFLHFKLVFFYRPKCNFKSKILMQKYCICDRDCTVEEGDGRNSRFELFSCVECVRLQMGLIQYPTTLVRFYHQHAGANKKHS